MKLKTLKDFKREDYSLGDDEKVKYFDERKLKAEAINWVKEDMKDIELIKPIPLLERWMDRLNITEEDLI